MPASAKRRLTAGVECQSDGGVHVRVWAPRCRSVEFVREGREHLPITQEPDGYFSADVPDAAPGDRYWFRLDGDALRPDPVSRYQPEGPHGPSAIVDPATFAWTDEGWSGLQREGQVLYEMHVGTFTPEGTWTAAGAQLEELKRLGVTTIEMMPVSDFAGRFGWGYDGVNLYAPTRLYGSPDDLRAFVNRAHALGIGVLLDVVYNHLGPDGNYLADFSSDYFTDRYKNDWGQAINFEGSPPARDFFVENAGYWIDEFHFDGLRLDATQDIHDNSDEHVIVSIVRAARRAARGRNVLIIAENEPQDSTLVRPESAGGAGLDALWNDDYHHSIVVALTGRREAYYTDYKGSVQELLSCAKYGFLYQGQWYQWQKQPRGTAALDLPGCAFVCYMENHDQVANSPFGRRLHQLSSPARIRTLTAITLLGPATPMLFQGQEFGSTVPFLYFADHREELREPIRRGRREFLEQFTSVARDPELKESLPSPVEESTFLRCKLNLDERDAHQDVYAMHRDLLAIRRTDPVIAKPRRVDGAVITSEAFVMRFFGDDGDRLLVVNLGCDLEFGPGPEPLLAPPAGAAWELMWSSESIRYGGQGTTTSVPDGPWRVLGEAAMLMRSIPKAAIDD